VNALPYIDAWLEGEAENAELRRLLWIVLVGAAERDELARFACAEIEARFLDRKEACRDAA